MNWLKFCSNQRLRAVKVRISQADFTRPAFGKQCPVPSGAAAAARILQDDGRPGEEAAWRRNADILSGAGAPVQALRTCPFLRPVKTGRLQTRRKRVVLFCTLTAAEPGPEAGAAQARGLIPDLKSRKNGMLHCTSDRYRKYPHAYPADMYTIHRQMYCQ